MNQSGIYKIENVINNKVYVGQAVNIYKRIQKHKTDLRQGYHHNKHLQRSYDKHGLANFTFETLELVDIGDLTRKEQEYIDFYRSIDNSRVYNAVDAIDTGKNKTGYMRSDESKQKQRVSRSQNGLLEFYDLEGISASIEQHAARFGVKRRSVRNYMMRQNLSLRDALELCKINGHLVGNNNVNKFYTLNGVTKCIKDWAEHFNISFANTQHKLKLGWSYQNFLDHAKLQDESERLRFCRTLVAKKSGVHVEFLGHVGSRNTIEDLFGISLTSTSRTVKKYNVPYSTAFLMMLMNSNSVNSYCLEKDHMIREFIMKGLGIKSNAEFVSAFGNILQGGDVERIEVVL